MTKVGIPKGKMIMPKMETEDPNAYLRYLNPVHTFV